MWAAPRVPWLLPDKPSARRADFVWGAAVAPAAQAASNGRPAWELARFLVILVLAAVRAELLDLEAIGIVAAVLLRDVVTVLAHLAGQGDLGANIC